MNDETVTFNGMDAVKLVSFLRHILVTDTPIAMRERAMELLEAATIRKANGQEHFPNVGLGQVEIKDYAGNKVYVGQREFSEMMEFMRDDKKIQAIKVMRMATGCGLKEAKDFVEQCSLFQNIRRY